MSIQNTSQELFKDLIGQCLAIDLLQSSLIKKRLAPAYLFSGPNGVGRKLGALRFVEGIFNEGNFSHRERHLIENNNHPDLLLIEPTYLQNGTMIAKSLAEEEGLKSKNPPQIRLDQIRSLKAFLSNKPVKALRTIVIIDGVEQMGETAANALLKTLEEPGNGILILISSRPERLIDTIRSRCQNIPFVRLTSEEVLQVLKNSKEVENNLIKLAAVESNLLKLADGSPGNLLNNIKFWDEIPNQIFEELAAPPMQALEALSLARDICEALNIEQQIWLINWLQQYFWDIHKNEVQFKQLEKLRKQLIKFVQPRLAWEITLLELIPTVTKH